jgi:hypothetical protein
MLTFSCCPLLVLIRTMHYAMLHLNSHFPPCVFRQGSLTEGEGSVLLTSLYYQLLFKLNMFFNKTSCLNEEVNCTEPSPSVSFPSFRHQTKIVKSDALHFMFLLILFSIYVTLFTFSIEPGLHWHCRQLKHH